ncbi:hypothetical protein AB0G73_13540 [Streptomyces sp. NPDC020719]|uniref:hypothetical protein n=1 Tax=unclassified Streptomyces TaxID=2593676 RepID=UPI0033F95458
MKISDMRIEPGTVYRIPDYPVLVPVDWHPNAVEMERQCHEAVDGKQFPTFRVQLIPQCAAPPVGRQPRASGTWLDG